MGKILNVATMAAAITALGMATGASSPARAGVVIAPTLANAYLFSNWSAPTQGSSPAFTFQGTTGVELNLTGTTVTGISNTGPIVFDVDQALTYAAHTNTINSGEPLGVGGQEARVNREVGTWDDAGIVNDGADDANLNVDYGRDAEVVFNPLGAGYTALIIAEDAAFDPLGLSICRQAACTQRLPFITGFTPGAIAAILARPDFVADDNDNPREMDQAYLFLFEGNITAFTAVTEIGNPDGAKLEVDFIGTGTVVPIPGAVWLFGTGLVALFGFARRKRAAATA